MDRSDDFRTRYFVLMDNEPRLYLFESEDSIRCKAVIPLLKASVYPLHYSYFDRSHCFQIVHRGDDEPSDVVYMLYADTGADYASWMSLFKKFSFCCSQCKDGPKQRAVTTRTLKLTIR